MSHALRVLLVFLLLFFFSACSDKPSKTNIKIQGSTMGTQYHIVLAVAKDQQVDSFKLKTQLDNVLLQINQQMSTYIPSSEISRFNRYKKTQWFPVSKDFTHVVQGAQTVSKQSNGAFDTTISPLIELWGFGSTTQFTVPTKQQIQGALQNTGYQNLLVRNSPPALRKLNPNLRIDLSAIAKGFAVDKLFETLAQENYTNFLIEIGGEVRTKGLNYYNKPWKIGIETPQTTQFKISKMLLTSNIAMATSGDYRNYFIKNGVRFSHTINPKTGKPVIHKLASVTVFSNTTMMADAYATTLMVLGDKKAKVFVKNHNLKVNMIIREGDNYQTWKNFDETMLLH